MTGTTRIDIVLLAAGLSERMGATNKMLLPVNGIPLCVHCASQALKYLQSADTGGNLIIVTGYRYKELEKTLEEGLAGIETGNTATRVLFARNPDFEKGQFTSAKTGVSRVSEDAFFFISLADMPLIKADNYQELETVLQQGGTGFDAVRPFADGKPGHPVLLAPSLKNRILSLPDSFSMRELLSSCNTLNVRTTGNTWTTDIDYMSDYSDLSFNYKT